MIPGVRIDDGHHEHESVHHCDTDYWATEEAVDEH